MNKNESRQDWFRLNKPTEKNSLGHQSARAASNLHDSKTGSRNEPLSPTLTPIERPPNHNGMDLSNLPPMREAALVTSQIHQLFSDIGIFATEIQLMQKRNASSKKASASRAEDQRHLEFAKDALISGQVARVQIRYKWDQALWIDTLTAVDEGFKLVRIKHHTSSNC